MSEEEKKAVIFLKHYLEDDDVFKIANKDLRIILNLIEKQQKELNTLKKIEQQHKTDNGLLRQELDMQIEHNKELEATLKQTQNSWFEDTQKLEQEKEKNKELEKQINLNKKTVEIAQTQILEYSQGYKDGLNKETTATAIVARELELNFIRQEIKHKYISKDKIKEKIEETNNEKLNYSEDEYYLENEVKGYAIDKLKELLEEK